MSDQEKPDDVQEPASKPVSRGGGIGGDLLIGAVLLVIGAVCVKDGFISPPEGWDHWKIVFNQVIVVVGLLGGTIMIVKALLRPRSTPPSTEDSEPKGEEQKPSQEA